MAGLELCDLLLAPGVDAAAFLGFGTFDPCGRIGLNDAHLYRVLDQAAEGLQPVVAFEWWQLTKKRADDVAFLQIAESVVAGDVAYLFEDPVAHAARVFGKLLKVLALAVIDDYRTHRPRQGQGSTNRQLLCSRLREGIIVGGLKFEGAGPPRQWNQRQSLVAEIAPSPSVLILVFLNVT